MRQVLCFGDSNTYGYVPGTAERYDWDTRWTGIVGTGLMEKGYIVQEEGLCGRTTVFDDPLRPGRRGSELLPIILETHKPEDLIRDGAPSAKILLMSPIALGEKVWDGFDPEVGENSVQVSKELPEIYRQIAEEEGLYYLAASDYAVPSERDQEHMDEEGHKALAEAVLEKISEIL